jgi:hypothetical protein
MLNRVPGPQRGVWRSCSPSARKNRHDRDLRGGRGPVRSHSVRAAFGAGYDDCCTSGLSQGRSGSKPHGRCGVYLSGWVALAPMRVDSRLRLLPALLLPRVGSIIVRPIGIGPVGRAVIPAVLSALRVLPAVLPPRIRSVRVLSPCVLPTVSPMVGMALSARVAVTANKLNCFGRAEPS